MQFKIDENLPTEIADLLRQHGHEALTIADQHLSGERDSRIAQVCQAEQRALITLDLDFADIRTYPPASYHGIIVLRPAVQNIGSLMRLMSRVVPLLGKEALGRRLWISDDSRVRIRGEDAPAAEEQT
jgi:predicted nuclease of predicted toxin-antitoxin system